MMKIQLKRLVDTKWRAININELVGKSICSFICESDDDIIAAIFNDEDEPIAFMSNDMNHLQRYKLQGKLCLDPETLKALVGTDVMPSLVAQMFSGSALVGIRHESSEE